MNEIANCGDRRMSVREVAEALGCTPETVKSHIRVLWPDLMKNGVTTYLTETQVTVILEKLKIPVSSGAKSNLQFEIAGVETSQSRVLKLQMLQKQMQNIYEAEIADLKAKAEADKPKVEFYDQVAGSGDAISIREVAAILNIPGWGQNRIFALLRGLKILDIRNVPYREYQDRGYFRVIEQKWTDKEGDTHINLKTLVYQKGVDFIRKIIQKQEAV